MATSVDENVVMSPAETIQISIGSGKVRSSVVIAKEEEEIVEIHSKQTNTKEDEKQQKVETSNSNVEQKETKENKSSVTKPIEPPIDQSKRKIVRSTSKRSKSKEQTNKSPDKKRQRSRSKDRKERTQSSSDRRHSDRRSPVRRRSKSPPRSNYSHRQQDFVPRWQDRGRQRGGYDMRRGGRYDRGGRGRGGGYVHNDNRRYDNRRHSRENRDRSPAKNRTFERKVIRGKRKSDTSPARKSSSSSSSSSSSESNDDDVTKKETKTSKEKLSREEEKKIKKELQEIEMKMKKIQSKGPKEGNVESENISTNEKPPVDIEASTINVAIHSGNGSVEPIVKPSKTLNEQSANDIPPVATQNAQKVDHSDADVSLEKSLKEVQDVNNQESAAGEATVEAESESEEEIKKKKKKKTKKRKHKSRKETSDSDNENIEHECMKETASKEDNEISMEIVNEPLIDSAVKSVSADDKSAGQQIIPEIQEEGEEEENQASTIEQDDSSQNSTVEQDDSSQSSGEEKSKSSSSDNDESTSAEEENSSESSNESESSSESEPVKKKSKKKRSKKKKKRQRNSSDSSTESSSDDDDSSDGNSKRRSKKKKRKHKKKKSGKRKSKQSRKSKKNKEKAVVMDPSQFTSWMEEQKLKMREEILNELKTSIKVELPQNIVANKDSSKVRDAFEEINKAGEKDAEIAESESEIEMETKDGFPTGIPLRKEQSEVANVSDLSNDAKILPPTEEVFTLFKSDDELDYDLDDNDDSNDEENWKRQASREKDGDALKKTDEKVLKSSRRRRERESKRSTKDISVLKEGYSRSRSHHSIKDAEVGRDRRDSKKDKHRSASSRREEKTEVCKEKSGVEASINNSIKPILSSVKVDELKKTISTLKDDNEKTRLKRTSHDKREPIITKRSVSKEKTTEKKISSKTTHSRFDIKPAPRIEVSAKQEQQFDSKSAAGFTNNTLSTHISPLMDRTPEDGIAIANQVRDNAVKYNDFWNANNLVNLKRPINANDNVFGKDSIDKRDKIEENLVNDQPLAKAAVNVSEGHWEAPFSGIQSRLQSLADPKQLYSAESPRMKVKESTEKERGNRQNYTEDRKFTKTSDNITCQDLPIRNRDEIKRYSDNNTNGSRRNEDRHISMRNEPHGPANRKHEFERSENRRRDDPKFDKRNVSEDYRNRDKAYATKEYNPKYKDRIAPHDEREPRNDYRSRDFDKHENRKRDYKREDSKSDKYSNKIKRTDVDEKKYERERTRSLYSPIKSTNPKDDNRRYSQDTPSDYREKLNSNKTMDFRDILNKNKEGKLFSPASEDSENDKITSHSKTLTSTFTRPEKNYRGSKR